MLSANLAMTKKRNIVRLAMSGERREWIDEKWQKRTMTKRKYICPTHN